MDIRPQQPQPRPAPGQGQFEKAIDDLMNKKYGMGYIYYGERRRLSTTEDELDQPIIETPKEDPILVVGGTGRTGQWITLGLLNQGFNVRVLTRNSKNAEKIFGPSGSNVDVVEGNLQDPSSLRGAVRGAVGLVLAAAPDWWLPGGSEAVEARGAAYIIQYAAEAGSMNRAVLLSSSQNATQRAKNHAMAETALRSSGIPYAIVRVPSLSDAEGGLSKIHLAPLDANPATSGTLSRLDAALITCQVFVHDRLIKQNKGELSSPTLKLCNLAFNACNIDEPADSDLSLWPEKIAAFQVES